MEKTRMVLRVFRRTRSFVCLAALSLFTIARAEATPRYGDHEICDRAAARASAQSGVPFKILLAITRAETGRTKNGDFGPWPWTINMEGTGHWFDNKQMALSHTSQRLRGGARNFDVGCFQINYRWHGEAFSSLEQMFEPQANADYAARFLLRLYGELGDWSRAVAAYHSRTPEHASRYLARFKKLYSRLDDTLTPTVAPSEWIRAARLDKAQHQNNTFPLLQQTLAPASNASLVPLESRPMSGRFIQSFVE